MYNGFESRGDEGVSLGKWLSGRGIADLDIVGIATERCVKAMALGARDNGFAARVRLDLRADPPESPGATSAACEEMRDSGITLTSSSEV